MKNNFYENYWTDSDNAIPTDDPTTKMRIEYLKKTLDRERNVGKILDAGCGSGYFTSFLKVSGYETTGMDVSKNAVSAAGKNYPHIDFVHSPLDERWPFDDASFDAIFTTEVIEHVYGTYEMFGEMNRALRDGGILMLTTPFHGLCKNIIIALAGFDNHFNNIEGGHIRFFTKKFLCRLFDMYGFKLIETRYIGRIRPFSKSIYMVARKVECLSARKSDI